MGSKRLKGVVVWGTRDLYSLVVDRKRWIEETGKLAQRLASGPTAKALHTYGTNVLTNIINSIGGSPRGTSKPDTSKRPRRSPAST